MPTNEASGKQSPTQLRGLPAPAAPGMPLDTRLRSVLLGESYLSGVFCGLHVPALIEMAAFAGFDFVVIDNEHGVASFETTEHMLRAARASGIVPIVRCFQGTYGANARASSAHCQNDSLPPSFLSVGHAWFTG